MPRRNRAGRTRRWLTWVLGAPLILCLLAYGGVLAYFDRSEDRLVFTGAFMAGLDPWDGHVGVPWDSVRVEAEDGLPVFLLESPLGDDTAPWVLFFHGNGNFVGSFGPTDDYRLLREAGFNVLAVEYRGYGASAGSPPSEEGIYADARAGWEHLTGERGVAPDRIVLFGSSLGSGIATWLATQVEPAGLITKGAFTSLPAAARGPYPWLPTGFLMENRFENLRRASSIDEPWLLFHNRDDGLIPLHHAEALFDAAPAAELVVLDGGHNDLLSAESELVLEALERFRRRSGLAVPEMTEGFVDAGNDVRLYYRVVGSGPDTVVVLHGGPGFDMEYFAADLEPLANRIALVFYDQRGAGRSSLVRDSLQLDARLFAEDLEAVRRHFGLERMTILGHSWGAGVAALYAMRYPSRVGRMLVVGGVPLRQRLLGAAFEQMSAERDSAELRRMGELYEARVADPEDADTCRAYYVLWFRPFFADSAAMDRSRGDFCGGTPESLRNKMESVDRFTGQSLGDWDWREPLRDMSAPTLIIHGTADPIPVEGAREWAATLPDARLLLLDGVGHFPYLEDPDRFFPSVRQFVGGEWPAAAQH